MKEHYENQAWYENLAWLQVLTDVQKKAVDNTFRLSPANSKDSCKGQGLLALPCENPFYER